MQITKILQNKVQDLSPDMVVVSGDLTTRARTKEFEDAKQFLESLPGKQIVVPGNHDISLYNIVRRFFKPLERFKDEISAQVEPEFINSEVTVIGLNSSRSFTIKGGNISTKQIERVKNIVNSAPQGSIRIIVTHHPPSEMSSNILERLMKHGVEIIISGHMHKSSVKIERKNIDGEDRDIILIKAGTATSVRYRDEPNSFNHIEINGAEMKLKTYTWVDKSTDFEMIKEENFVVKSVKQSF